jgi:flagellar biosynthetic protein FlhB
MSSGEDKTEAATPKRRSQARSRGQVAKSMELSSMTVLLGVLIALHNGVGRAGGLMLMYFQGTLRHLDDTRLTSQILMQVGAHFCLVVAQALAPLLLTAMILGVIVNIAQTGPMWATEALKPNFNKLNPLTGFKRFFSPRSLVELVKASYKIGLVCYIAWTTIQGSYPKLMLTSRMDLMEGMSMVGELAYRLALRIVMTMLVLAALDFAYQRWSTEKSMRMSKAEVKQEFKNMEGSPQMKARIRARQRAMAKKRMMADVPTADVIVTNPTHFAVALKYDPARMNAPIVVAKGQDWIALKIRELAQQNDVPIMENPPLARSLYKNGIVGREIPGDLYEAVAEVLAFVYQINQRRAGRGGQNTHVMPQ